MLTTLPSTALNSIDQSITFGRISTKAPATTSAANASSSPLTTLTPIIVALVVLLVLIAVVLALYYKRRKALKKPFSNTDHCTAEEPQNGNGQVPYVNVHANHNQEMIDNVLYMSRASNQAEDENEQNPYNNLQHFTKFTQKGKMMIPVINTAIFNIPTVRQPRKLISKMCIMRFMFQKKR